MGKVVSGRAGFRWKELRWNNHCRLFEGCVPHGHIPVCAAGVLTGQSCDAPRSFRRDQAVPDSSAGSAGRLRGTWLSSTILLTTCFFSGVSEQHLAGGGQREACSRTAAIRTALILSHRNHPTRIFKNQRFKRETSFSDDSLLSGLGGSIHRSLISLTFSILRIQDKVFWFLTMGGFCFLRVRVSNWDRFGSDQTPGRQTWWWPGHSELPCGWLSLSQARTVKGSLKHIFLFEIVVLIVDEQMLISPNILDFTYLLLWAHAPGLSFWYFLL